MLLSMSVITTANNAFTYTNTTTSSDVYIANNINAQIVFDSLSAYNYYIKTDANKHMIAIQPTEITLFGPGGNLTANINSIILTHVFSQSYNVAIITLMIPIQIDDFTQITSSDTMSIDVVIVNERSLFSTTVSLNRAPVTMYNNTIFVKNIPKGGVIRVVVRIPYNGKYILPTKGPGNLLNPVNANTIVCF